MGNTPVGTVSVLANHPLLSGVRNEETTFEPFMIIVLLYYGKQHRQLMSVALYLKRPLAMPVLHPGLGLFYRSGVQKNDLELLSCGTKAMKVGWGKKFLQSPNCF